MDREPTLSGHLDAPSATASPPAADKPAADKPAIREQLQRVLTSAHFRNSKRCQSLLRFVTECLLEGEHEDLREKIIGMKVFGREAAYDTAHDAIVRNVAVEVRKRLAQYYCDADHERELRIDLPAGSYTPVFTVVPDQPAALAVPAAPPVSEQAPRRWRRVILAACAALLLVAAGAAIYSYTSEQDFDRFWAPLFRTHEVVHICVGQPGRIYRFIGPRQAELDGLFAGPAPKLEEAEADLKKNPITAADIRWNALSYLYMRDAFSMARLACLVQSKGAAFRLSSDTTTSYTELRRSPVIVIGGFNSHWGLRFAGGMQFVFDHGTIDGVDYNGITDRRHPAGLRWKVPRLLASPPDDYAIVTRAVDPTTERTVVLVAGIADWGTQAAGEFITDASYMNAALRNAPRGWQKKNIQLVLHTRIIEGSPGPATVLAMNFW